VTLTTPTAADEKYGSTPTADAIGPITTADATTPTANPITTTTRGRGGSNGASQNAPQPLGSVVLP
jgi:hypothetical protein